MGSRPTPVAIGNCRRAGVGVRRARRGPCRGSPTRPPAASPGDGAVRAVKEHWRDFVQHAREAYEAPLPMCVVNCTWTKPSAKSPHARSGPRVGEQAPVAHLAEGHAGGTRAVRGGRRARAATKPVSPVRRAAPEDVRVGRARVPAMRGSRAPARDGHRPNERRALPPVPRRADRWACASPPAALRIGRAASCEEPRSATRPPSNATVRPTWHRSVSVAAKKVHSKVCAQPAPARPGRPPNRSDHADR
jgi:hypothetical protein